MRFTERTAIECFDGSFFPAKKEKKNDPSLGCIDRIEHNVASQDPRAGRCVLQSRDRAQTEVHRYGRGS